MSALLTGTCALASTFSSFDRSSQWIATYISAKTNTPCSAISLRQLSYLLRV